MIERRAIVTDRFGLHARAAARLVHLANSFQSKITLRRADNRRSVDAKSIFGVLMLAATKGTALVVSATGQDESAAVDAIAQMIEGTAGG